MEVDGGIGWVWLWWGSKGFGDRDLGVVGGYSWRGGRGELVLYVGVGEWVVI